MNPPKKNIKYIKQIQKIKHEKDTAEEVMKALCKANFNKIQISTVADKETQLQKLNSTLKKEKIMKNIIAKDEIELKAQSQTLQTKPRKV